MLELQERMTVHVDLAFRTVPGGASQVYTTVFVSVDGSGASGSSTSGGIVVPLSIA